MEVLLAILLLLFGFLLILLAKWCRLELGEAAKTTILLAPLVVHLLFSNIIEELDAGGIKAKLKTISASTVGGLAEAAKTQNASALLTDPKQLELGTESLLFSCRESLSIDRNDLRKIFDDRGLDIPVNGREDPMIVLGRVLYNSLSCGKFIAMVVLDEGGRPLGAMDAAYFTDLLSIPFHPRAYVLTPPASQPAPFQVSLADLVRTTSLGNLALDFDRTKALPSFHDDLLLPYTEPVGKAYATMREKDEDLAVLVSPSGHFEGLLSRRAIENWTTEQILQPDEPSPSQ
ncbi:MAG: hypothetical protein HY834_18105 [Devosia nanyangense]|uniref:CBS domain-containing protein n=1 Tax=Devosia nanyangense TaxID=1228055 RepID=A0A933L4T8_9HYPH|nr:hypothetical protein [Devosia nanyangense]